MAQYVYTMNRVSKVVPPKRDEAELYLGFDLRLVARRMGRFLCLGWYCGNYLL